MEAPLMLVGGRVIEVRAIRPDDSERLRALFRRLSPETVIFRFFRFLPDLPEADALAFAHVDYENTMALVATTGAGADEQIRAVVRYARTDLETAEVAFVVEDPWQGHGIATALLHRLAAYARARRFATFTALTMGDNTRMLDVLLHARFPYTLTYMNGEIEAHLDISAPEQVRPR
jgi:GNAT superfamily N-acetyltransferase